MQRGCLEGTTSNSLFYLEGLYQSVNIGEHKLTNYATII